MVYKEKGSINKLDFDLRNFDVLSVVSESFAL